MGVMQNARKGLYKKCSTGEKGCSKVQRFVGSQYRRGLAAAQSHLTTNLSTKSVGHVTPWNWTGLSATRDGFPDNSQHIFINHAGFSILTADCTFLRRSAPTPHLCDPVVGMERA
jgi:hypothetical protein